MAKSKTKRKFRVRYVVLGILVLILVAVGTVTVTNWDNIQAGYAGLTSDPEEIQAKQAEKKSQLEQDLGVSGGFTEEEMSAAQEAVASILPDSLAEFLSGSNVTDLQNAASGDSGILEGTSESAGSSGSSSGTVAGNNGSSGSAGAGGSSTSGSDTSTTAGSSGPGSSTVSSSGSGSGDAGVITRKYTSQLYALEGSLQGKINSIAASAKAEYAALPASERTSSAKAAIISSKVSEAEALESSCDAAVETILSNMQSELKAAGADTSSVSQLREYYESEKASKKAAAIAAMRAG